MSYNNNHKEEIQINGKTFELEVKPDVRISAFRWKLNQVGFPTKRDGIATKANMALSHARAAAFSMA